MGTKEKTSDLAEVFSKEELMKSLVLFNDDHNTFDFIISSLVDVCEHNSEQAENCALIAHYNGKCQIKKGIIDKLRPLYVEMTNRQITVDIV